MSNIDYIVGYSRGYADALRANLASTVKLEDPKEHYPYRFPTSEEMDIAMHEHQVRIYDALRIKPEELYRQSSIDRKARHDKVGPMGLTVAEARAKALEDLKSKHPPCPHGEYLNCVACSPTPFAKPFVVKACGHQESPYDMTNQDGSHWCQSCATDSGWSYLNKPSAAPIHLVGSMHKSDHNEGAALRYIEKKLDKPTPLQDQCQHEYKQYVGIMESYQYCTKCDAKVRE
jgi:hypothetical protein